jgi:hypothetical protein
MGLLTKKGIQVATPVLEQGMARAKATHHGREGTVSRGWVLELGDARVLAHPEYFEHVAPLQVEEVNRAR